MTLIIGLVLVSIGLAIFIVAILKGKKKINIDEPSISEDVAIQRAFEVIENLPESQKYNAQLLGQESAAEKLIILFDELFENNQIQAAEKIVNILSEYSPNMDGISTRMGLILLRMGNFDRAAENLQNAIENNPEDIRAANNLSYIYNRMKRYEDTINILEPLLSDDNIVTLVNLGIAYFHTGNAEKSYELLNAAYKKNPKIPEIHLYIGNCLRIFGEEEKAQKAFQRYLILSGKIDIHSDENGNDERENLVGAGNEKDEIDSKDELNNIDDNSVQLEENSDKNDAQSDNDISSNKIN